MTNKSCVQDFEKKILFISKKKFHFRESSTYDRDMSELILLLLPDSVGFTSSDLTIVERLQGELRFLRDVPLRSSKEANKPNLFNTIAHELE